MGLLAGQSAPNHRISMTKTRGTKDMDRMSKMKRIGDMLIACSSGSENRRRVWRAEHQARDSKRQTWKQRSSLSPDQSSLSSRYFLKRSKIYISHDVKFLSGSQRGNFMLTASDQVRLFPDHIPNLLLRTAKKNAVESPHIKIPVKPSSGPKSRNSLGSTRSP